MAEHYDILACTGCPTGIAHTFMAKEGLEQAAKAKGLTIKVETHGQEGVKNAITAEDIANAKAVVIAADVNVDEGRFASKPMVMAGVTAGIKDPAGLIDRALVAKPANAGASVPSDEELAMDNHGFEKGGIGQEIYKHLMNGVSHMLPFVVAGGVLTAVSFLWGITSFDSTAADYNAFAAMLKTIGGIAMNLMVPVLAAYIAESIAGRPGLVPGFVAGMIAITGLPVNAETGLIDAGGAGVGFGFLGGIIGGFLAGYVIEGLKKAFSRLPENLNGLKAIFLYPLCSTLITGLAMLATGLTAGQGTAAYADGTAFMAAVSAACIAPPLVTTFATVVGRKYFTQEDRDAGLVNFILGCTHITEGAIPFMTKNIWPVMPIMMLSSSIAAILTLMLGVHVPAPHGGFLVLPVVENPIAWIGAILIGSVVGGMLFVLFKKSQYDRERRSEGVGTGTTPNAA